MEFDKLPLHDASILSIDVDLQEYSASVELKTFMVSQQRAADCRLKFFSVESVQLPMRKPWGSSQSINQLSRIGSLFSIEMQSGDTLTFEAGAYEFDRFGK